MVTKSTPRRSAPEPQNTSRGAGAAAPASAAATAPRESTPRPVAPEKPTGGPAPAFYEDDPALHTPRSADSVTSGLAQAARFFEPKDHVQLEQGGTADIEVVEREAREVHDDDESLAEAIERIRATRRPLGQYTQKLALPKRRGYERHWFNDIAGRIDDAKANGWSHVKDADGRAIARCVGTGRDKGALFAFAMEIPEVFAQEDRDARHRAASERVDALKAAPFRAQSGTADKSDKGKFYDPTESDQPLQIEKH